MSPKEKYRLETEFEIFLLVALNLPICQNHDPILTKKNIYVMRERPVQTVKDQSKN